MFWKQKKEHVIFSWWWCNFETQQNLDKYIKLVGAEFNSEPVYDEKYINTGVKTFEGKELLENLPTIPKENTHYSCIATICQAQKARYDQVNLEQRKIRLKKKEKHWLI